MKRTIALTLLAALLAPGLAADEAGRDKLEELLSKVADDSHDVRFSARSLAPEVGAAAVVPLGEMLVLEKREAALTARAALERIVHHSGRPGAEGERGPVAAELKKLLDAGRPAAVKREVLHLIAFIGDDGAVPSAAALLEDPDEKVREAARQSLERIPGKAALAALLDAARRAPAERKGDFIYSLSKKGDRSVVKALLVLASAGEAEVRWRALEALARLGAPEGVELLAREIQRAGEVERQRLYDEYLRLADNLRGAEEKAADSIYRRSFIEAPLDYQREHALGAACPPGSAERLPLLIAGASDSSARVRRIAGQRLSELKGQEVFLALGKAYQAAQGPARPLLLRALADRDAAAARQYLEPASRDENAEVKITALDLLDRLDDPGLEPVYLRTAESGADWLRPTALKGFLILARGKVEKKRAGEALPMFERALDLAREAGPRREALRGILSVGDPRSIGRLEGLLKDPQLAGEAARGYITLAAAIGKGGDREDAEKRLMGIVKGDFSRDLKGQAARELKDLGLDPQRVAHSQGFVVNWHVVTPLPNEDGKGLERKDFPEEVIELDKEHRVGERKFVWQKLEDLSPDGHINLIPLFRRSENRVTYAYTELEFPAPREVLFKMGSDDGIACWLNGERLHLNNVSRGFKVDEDSVKARLIAGKNRVLLKISQKDGDWAFSFRLTDPEGKPIDLTAKLD